MNARRGEKLIRENETLRANLEWLVYWCLRSDDPPISIGRGKELLGFTDMVQMREWMNKKAQEADRGTRNETV